MEENLVGYLLNSLDDATHREVEAFLRNDPQARAHLALLRDALAPLQADSEAPAPPPGLAARTVARFDRVPTRKLPHAPALVGAAEGGRPFWRRMDYLIAASLLFIAVGLGVQGLYVHVQKNAAKVLCEDNLRQLAGGLKTYQDMHSRLPDVTAVQMPRPAAGLVVPIMMDAGTLPPQAAIRCPSADADEPRPLSLSALRNLNPEEFEKQVKRLTSYAYSLGFNDDRGYHAPQTTDATGAALPLMADGPPAEVRTGNNVLHGVPGQNVLFHDGHVRFLTSRMMDGQDDIYLNWDNKVAAGLNRRDAVLGSSGSQP